MGGLFGTGVGPNFGFEDIHKFGSLFTPKKVDTTPASGAQADAQRSAMQFEIERQARMNRPGNAPQITGASIEAPPPMVALPPAPPPPGGMAQGFGGPGAGSAYYPGSQGPTIPVDAPARMVNIPPPPNYIDPVRQRQLAALDMLTDAAQGSQPSAAELASKAAADRAAAQQFGIAAALQGGMSAGGALRQASEGSASLLGQNAADRGSLRAKEMSDARGQLVQGLGGLRGQEDTLATDQARMNLDAQITNAKLQLESRGLDQEMIQDLLQARLREEGYSIEMAKAILDGNAKNTAADNAFKAQIINTAVTGAALA